MLGNVNADTSNTYKPLGKTIFNFDRVLSHQILLHSMSIMSLFMNEIVYKFDLMFTYISGII